MIFIWKNPIDPPDELIGKYQKGRSPDRFLFTKGTRISDPGPACFQFDAAWNTIADYDVLPNNTRIPLVSSAVAKWLEADCRDDVQLISTVIETADQRITDYKLLNVLNCVSCLDRNRSSYVCIPNTSAIMKFNRLVLRTDSLGQHNIARLTEYPMFILVSGFLKQKFDSMSWKDANFVPPENITP